MNAVGIDVSKGKSMVAVLRPFGEVVMSPFEVDHTDNALQKLVEQLKQLEGETKVVMEYTGTYFLPIAQYLQQSGFFVCVAHALLIHDYGANSIRRVKTDKKDSLKIANYGIDHWLSLREYTSADEVRQTLKIYSRQYAQYMKTKVALKNNLISLLDQTLPGIKLFFTSPARADGHEKWIDFAEYFWHCERIAKLSELQFIKAYNSWCRRRGYQGSNNKAKEIHTHARDAVTTMPCSKSTKLLIQQATTQVSIIGETLAVIMTEMQRLASILPEYPVVKDMYGMGEKVAPRIIAEIGDVSRFERKQSLVAFAGVDAPPHQSGTFEAKDRSISKRGSPQLRKALYEAMICILLTTPQDDPVYRFMDKKRLEGKPYKVYIMAGANKFLRIYYARVTEYLSRLHSSASVTPFATISFQHILPASSYLEEVDISHTRDQ